MSRATAAARAAHLTAASLALIIASSSTAKAQEAAPRARSWEFRASSGALVVTGAERGHLKSGQLSAAQLSWSVRPRLALTGTFAWAQSRDLAAADAPKLDVFTTDIGLEGRSATWHADGPVSIGTFAVLGGGARSYNYRKLDEPATHNLAGFGGVGGDIGMGRVGLRLEARSYAAGFKPLAGVGRSRVGSDVVIMGALRFNRRRS